MNGKKSNAERLAVIETEIGYMKDDLKDLRVNDLPHIFDKVEKIESTLKTIQENIKGRWTGKDKALVYAALVTALIAAAGYIVQSCL